MDYWKGIVVAEGLSDPSIINDFEVFKVQITDDNKEIDYEGNKGRWHIYWINCNREQIVKFQSYVLDGWYAHFWDDENLAIVYNNCMFEVSRTNKLSWLDAIEHGKQQGIPEQELDFPTE